MKKTNAKISLFLSLVLICVIFAAGLAMAQDIEESNAVQSDDVNEDLEIEDQEQVNQAIDDSNLSYSDYAKVGFTSITKAQGWAIDGNNGYIVSALWATQTFINVKKSDVKQIREQYKGNPQEAMQNLRQLAEETDLVKKSRGFLKSGLGKDHSNFKLNRTDDGSSNTSITFDVYVLGERNQTMNKVGTLELSGNSYSEFVLWTGTLSLISGEKTGTYKISVASKSVFASGAGNAGAEKAKEKFLNSEEKQSEKRQNFLERWFGKRDKNQNKLQIENRGED